MYGDVTLDEPLNVGEAETLTIPEGSTLNTNGNLNNDGTIVNKGTMNGDPIGGSGTVVSTPTITTESLPEGTVNQPYTATLKATGNDIIWSVTESALPAGLTLNKSTGANLTRHPDHGRAIPRYRYRHQQCRQRRPCIYVEHQTGICSPLPV